jgi:hypothetical protein
MSKIARLAVLVAALASLFAVMSSSAGATTFTNSGATSFHGTGTGGTLGITNGSGGVSNLTCTGTDVIGVLGSGTFNFVLGNVTFAPCLLVGLHTKVACSYTWTASTFASGVTSGKAAVDCVASLATSPFTALCDITGLTNLSYTNPGTAGRFTLLASNTLVVTNHTDASCSATGVTTGTSKIGDLSEQSIPMTNLANSPIIASP